MKEQAIKAKGDELITKFRRKEMYGSDEMQFPKEHAVLCAIIAVEEIINAVTFPSPEMDYHKEKWTKVLDYLKSKL